MRQDLTCPKCVSAKLAPNERGDIFFCEKCDYEMPIPSYVWEKEEDEAD
jgi:ribosomal protein L37AE/L43A